MFKKQISFLYIFLFLLLSTTNVCGQKKFTLVIDAGHGGKDPGAVGSFSQEKDINLDVALKLGEKIQENNPDVNILYTRKTDIYLTVAERPKFANDVHADLFISIHANASTNPNAYGAETFTLGVAKTKENLEVAMLENSVILLEDDYKQNYQGFDPKSIESYIMFEFMQDKYMEHSIQLASLVQKQFSTICGRRNLGVKQAGFLVLKNTAMPSILVETGFMSNKEEEKYLNSKTGKEQLATAIYTAFNSFKHEFDKKSAAALNASFKCLQDTTTIDSTQLAKKDSLNNTQITSPKKIYKVQILVKKELLPENDPIFKGLKDIGHYYENNLYKYTYGESCNYEEIQECKKEVSKYFKEAFIVSFVNGEKINTSK